MSLVFSCGPAVLPPWGGTERLLSTSPIAAGFPTGPRPVIIDLALSTVARGKIAAYAQRGEPLPDGWALDADGNPTNDAQEALVGMLSPLGGAKGFALAYLVEALTGALIGPLSRATSPTSSTGPVFSAAGNFTPSRHVDPARTDVVPTPTPRKNGFPGSPYWRWTRAAAARCPATRAQ